MPTAPKLVAAIFFMALGWFCVDLIIPLLPEGTQVSLFNETIAIVGALCGWFMSGTRAGDGTRAGFGYGLTSSALMVFWGLLIFSGNEMLQLSLKRRYDGPMEAIKSMIEIGLENLVMIGTPSVIGTLIVGGLFGGWLTEWTAKRWS